MTLNVSVLVLPAFDELATLPSEATPWVSAYDLDEQVRIDGVPTPVRYADSGLAVVPTGVGKTAAAATTTALLSSDRLDLDDALVLSVGVAGGPPNLPVGSVVIADTIVDWDDKFRIDATGEVPIGLNPYTDDQGVFELDSDLVEEALTCSTEVDLVGSNDESGSASTEQTGPTVETGTNLCGDELWHGLELAQQAAWFVAESGAGPYRATEMEDAGTAMALERVGHLDRYLSIRGISNYDRPTADVSARRSLFDPAFEAGFERGIENAVRVARTVVDDRLT